MIFGQMKRQNKKTSFWRAVYKLVWLMEEKGIDMLTARVRTRTAGRDGARHLHNLYKLRRKHLVALGLKEYLVFERLDNKGFN